jgi:probable phosphoglycerate mutase
MSTNLYLIRHGEAVSNVEPWVMGGVKGCQGLTERGQAQVRALAARLETGEIAAEVLYASTLPRARQTAEAVAEALQLPITWRDELHELRPGDADGLTFEEAQRRFPSMQRFFVDFHTPIAPNGESWAAFLLRVSAELERIVAEHPGQKIAVVAHGGVIEASFLHLLQLGPQVRGRAAFHVRNTAITHWQHVETRDGRREWQLVTHNDHYHLRGVSE